jgi:Uma2 family endonuclease
MMFQYDPLDCLPSSAELPDSDDTPVDSELQILIPSLLSAVLASIWATREDWFFGINLGIY